MATAYSLRDSIYNLALQKPRTEILKKSFSYRGAKNVEFHFQTRWNQRSL